MSSIIAFSGSFSNASVNHSLVSAATQMLDYPAEVIRLQAFAAPIYTKELEEEHGIPQSVRELHGLFSAASGFLISVPEYNSSMPAGFKNTMDWLSRVDGAIFQKKPLLLMGTSPGGRGARSVLDHLSSILPYWGAELTGTFSLPRFHDHFADGRVTSPEHLNLLKKELQRFRAELPDT